MFKAEVTVSAATAPSLGGKSGALRNHACPQPVAGNQAVSAADRARSLRKGSPAIRQMSDDIRLFAETKAKKDVLTVLDAIDAIRVFTAEPTVNSALAIYEKFIQGTTLNFLGNRRTLGNILEDLLPRIDI